GRDLIEQLAVGVYFALDVTDIKIEGCIFKEEVDIFKVCLNVFVSDDATIFVQVILDLHLAVGKYLRVALPDEYVLVARGCFLTADGGQNVLEERHDIPDLLFMFGMMRSLRSAIGRRIENHRAHRIPALCRYLWVSHL